MSRGIAITGTGAVSPAGWGVRALMSAMLGGKSDPAWLQTVERKLGDQIVSTPALRVPPAPTSLPKAARLRRASPISRFAAAAVFEALGPDRLRAITAGELRVGVIFGLMNGCVNYSSRFFGEALADPTVASPILFPETVFNAPSSHLSAIIASSSPNDTLVGDSSIIFSGLDLAIEWIQRGDVDGCVVATGEEMDWLSAEGLSLYSRDLIASEGAAAVYIEPSEDGARILHLPDPVSLATRTRLQAARELRTLLHPGTGDSGTLLVDCISGSPGHDRPDAAAWSDWAGLRWSPRKIIGESMGAASGLELVAAVEALNSGLAERALAIVTGGNQQAAGILLGR